MKKIEILPLYKSKYCKEFYPYNCKNCPDNTNCGKFLGDGLFVKRKIMVRKITEKEIQSSCEYLLKLHRIRFLHIPDALLAFVMPKAPQWLRAIISKGLRGVPDIIAFAKSPDGYNHALLLELKTDKGVLSEHQKKWHLGLSVQVAYGLDDSIEAVQQFISFVKKGCGK